MTIKEISKLAGVSQSTVSLALNNKAGVGDETRKRIITIANEHGYSKKTNVVKKNILFVKYVSNGEAVEHNGDFVAGIIDAVELATSNCGYNFIMRNIQADNFEGEIEDMCFEGFVGVIWLATEISVAHIEKLAKIPIPVVAVDNMLEDYDIDSVVMDNHAGIFLATKYLYELGHRKIGYIDSTVSFSNFEQRKKGFKVALEKLGLTKNEGYIKKIQPTLEGAYTDMLEELKRDKELPTAFVAANDTIAIGSIKAFRQYGVDTPNKISIIGFDDIPFCIMLDKTLSTMRVNNKKMGEMAVYLLDNKINNPLDECIKITIRPKLITRESTSSPGNY